MMGIFFIVRARNSMNACKRFCGYASAFRKEKHHQHLTLFDCLLHDCRFRNCTTLSASCLIIRECCYLYIADYYYNLDF